MKKALQNLILIASLLVVTSANTKAQVVSAKCKTFVLTPVQVNYLKTFKDPVINRAIDSFKSIKYNSTADRIILMLSLPKAPKVGSLLLTSVK